MSAIRAVLLVAATAATGLAQGNVLLVVLDDVGVDRVACYGEHPSPGRTPTIDALAREGVLFRRCWANPYCSATRATILTGRYAKRTGIGSFVAVDSLGSVGLLEDEWTIPIVLRRATGGTHRAAAIGKWHLKGQAQGADHPERAGFELFAGSIGNLGAAGDETAYFHWLKLVNGSLTTVDRYATSETTDDALRAIRAFGEQPWLLYVSYNAAHLPLHAPPPDLHDFPLSGDPEDSPVPHHKAMVQALDRELGRLLAGIPPHVAERTTVIVVGDNGTQGVAIEPPFPPDHGKGTLFDGGIRVPLVVSGAGVPAGSRGAECAAPVNTTDLFATALALCGVEARATVPPDVELDSVDLTPYLADPRRPSLRDGVVAEMFRPNHPAGEYDVWRIAVSDGRHKLVTDMLDRSQKLYDSVLDPFEERDMLAQAPWSERARRLHAALTERLEDHLGPR